MEECRDEGRTCGRCLYFEPLPEQLACDCKRLGVCQLTAQEIERGEIQFNVELLLRDAEADPFEDDCLYLREA